MNKFLQVTAVKHQTRDKFIKYIRALFLQISPPLNNEQVCCGLDSLIIIVIITIINNIININNI
jgi:hypothetical protein